MAGRKLGLITVLVVLAVLGGGGFYWFSANGRGPAYRTAPEAVEALFAALSPGARVAVIPEGPYVLAKVSEAAIDTAARS